MNYFPATAGSDYVSVSMELTFLTGSSDGAMQCLSVSITDDDDTLEGNETFTVLLTTTDLVALGGAMATINIMDSYGIIFWLNPPLDDWRSMMKGSNCPLPNQNGLGLGLGLHATCDGID